MGNDKREAIASILDSQYRADHAMYLDEHDETADAVIAHLWEQAERPEVVEAVRAARNGNAVWNYEETMVAEGEEGSDEEIITALLLALIGPRPETRTGDHQ